MAGVFRAARTPTKSTSNRLLRWIYWRDYTCSEPAYRTFSEGSEIDRLKVELVYKKKEREGLWWWANCASGISSKATIRHHYTRVLRRAWEQALKERGYARDGSRRIEGDGKEGLTGSLQLLGVAKVADAPWDNVREQCLKVLDQVVKLQTTPLRARGRQKQRQLDHHRKAPEPREKPLFRRVSLKPSSTTTTSNPDKF